MISDYMQSLHDRFHLTPPDFKFSRFGGCTSEDHMYIEEYIEEDEEPPLLLSSCPSHGKYACLCSDRVVLGCGGTAAVQCRWGEGCVCLQCPAGQEPSKACGQIQSPTEEVQCRLCPAGSFSDALDSELCRPHASCKILGREVATPGNVTSDAVCGVCLPGFHSTAAGEVSTHSPCVKTSLHVRTVRTVGKGPSIGAGGPVNGTVVRSAEEKTAEYAVFALVPVFCVMGLLGILICNILKKKGYRCSADKEGGDEETATPQKEDSAELQGRKKFDLVKKSEVTGKLEEGKVRAYAGGRYRKKCGNSCPYISDDLNEDTISVLVRLITEKKALAAEESFVIYILLYRHSFSHTIILTIHPISHYYMMVTGSSALQYECHIYNSERRQGPLAVGCCSMGCCNMLCPHQSHLHTISGLSGLAPKHGYRCTRCAQRKWPPILIPPLDSLKDPLKPPQTLILPSLDTSTDQQKRPLLGGVFVDTHHTQDAVPNTVPEKVEGSEVKEKKDGELTVLSVGRFQVAQIPEQRPVIVESKTSAQEQRNSLFSGKSFCSSSSSGIRRPALNYIVKRQRQYDNATSLKMTSSFADHLTAGREGSVSRRLTTRNHKNHLLQEEVVSIEAIRGLLLYLLFHKQTLYFTDVSDAPS
ncbi:Tumor necrosis factor receptor superfamily member 19L [Collichthys lucidus]|uniref:Tumor necrosis factor receptor superfamily member 19L n=1 Tax=Collichthys lucidus TaxID=240159 RepID=A0A4U5V1U2_COLLU|nr:Tumor necrosis factor receptor superfamily member 19L [Collichthys lucidus]